MIGESLLQFIWQYSLYDPTKLLTADGEKIIVVYPGKLNRNAGPDFEEAKIRVGRTLLVGNVELHIKASDWDRHNHNKDRSYQNIILHVVYHDDKNDEEHRFPKLELRSHIPSYVIDQYSNLIQTVNVIPCASQLSKVNSLIKESWLNRMLAERWEEKLVDWKGLLNKTAGDWRKLLYWRLAVNFGFKVNAEPFLQLAYSIPINLFAKHKESLLQIEAMLFGQAGMLNDEFIDSYPLELQKEYSFLKAKYKLRPLEKHQWKFLRLRPANFPTIRIAQFAALVFQSIHLFSLIIESKSLAEIRKLLDVTASEYWDNHYRFEEEHKKPMKKTLGSFSIDNIIINTIAPIRFLFAHHQDDFTEQEKALQLLEEVQPEINKITTMWDENNWASQSASQSQALIQLFNKYCAAKRCLECAVGLSILKSRPDK